MNKAPVSGDANNFTIRGNVSKVPVSGNVGERSCQGEVKKRIPVPPQPAPKTKKRRDTPMPKPVEVVHPPEVIDTDSETDDFNTRFEMLYYLDHS